MSTVVEYLESQHGEQFDFAGKLTQFSKEHLTPDLFPINGTLDLVLVFFVARAHSTYESGVTLCRHGFAPEAVMQTRSLVESLINLRYIIDNPEYAQRYAEWDYVIKYQTLEMVRELGDAYDSLKEDWEARASEIDHNYEKFRDTYASFDKYRWAGKKQTLWKLAEETYSHDLYRFFYSFGSEIVHGSTVSSEYYMDSEREDRPVFKVGGRDMLVQQSLKQLMTVLVLYWDEISILKAEPTAEDIIKIPAPAMYYLFSRRRDLDANE